MNRSLCRLLCTMQCKLDAFFAPPDSVRGMMQLDRSAFRREVTLPAVFLREPSLCSGFLRRLKRTVLHYPRIRRILERPGGGGKVGHLKMSGCTYHLPGGALPFARFQCTHTVPVVGCVLVSQFLDLSCNSPESSGPSQPLFRHAHFHNCITLYGHSDNNI